MWGYSDFVRINKGDEETVSHFAFRVKSIRTGEIHHLRAFNSSSILAKQDINKAITVFLQETLRLCCIHPDASVIESFEFHNMKLLNSKTSL